MILVIIITKVTNSVRRLVVLFIDNSSISENKNYSISYIT